MENLTLFGVMLGALAVTAVKVAQDEFKFSDKAARWLRGCLGVAVYLAIANADAIATAWPLFETVIVQGGGALAILFGVLGYWPDLARIGARFTQGNIIEEKPIPF